MEPSQSSLVGQTIVHYRVLQYIVKEIKRHKFGAGIVALLFVAVFGTGLFFYLKPARGLTSRDTICERQGIKALLMGSISPLGSNYVITLEALNGQTGEAIAREQVEANGKEQVLSVLGKALQTCVRSLASRSHRLRSLMSQSNKPPLLRSKR